MSNTLSTPHLDAVVWIGVGAVGLTLLLILILLYLRVSLDQRLREEHRFLGLWRSLLLSSLHSSVPAVLPPLAVHDRVYFLHLWNDLIRAASGEAAHNLTDIAYSVGADIFSRRLLQYGSRVERLLATITLGHLRDQDSWELLVTHTLAADSITAIHAFHALVQIDAEATAQQLLPLLLAREDWPITYLATILQSAHGAFMFPLLEAVTEMPSTHLVRALRLIEALHLALPQNVVQGLLEKENDAETILAALRVANDAGLLPYVRRHLQHADWRIRVQAARVLGRIGEHADANRLIPLLADKEWWVRYRAAQALVGMPFFGVAEVELLRNHLSDRFARDMLGQVLAERPSS